VDLEKAMDDIEIATTREVFVGLVEGNPVQARFRLRAVNPKGHVRVISRSVPVTDADLLARLRGEARVGDTLEITTRTNWSSEDITEELTELRIVSRDVEPMAAAAS
jgi:hypothetical protein